MNLSELKARGAVVSAVPVPRDIEWTTPEGETLNFTVGIKRRSWSDVQNARAKEGVNYTCQVISELLFLGENLDEKLSIEDVEALDPKLAHAFISAINEVNGFSRAEPKNSQPPMSSGTSSSSTESAAEQ